MAKNQKKVTAPEENTSSKEQESKANSTESAPAKKTTAKVTASNAKQLVQKPTRGRPAKNAARENVDMSTKEKTTKASSKTVKSGKDKSTVAKTEKTAKAKTPKEQKFLGVTTNKAGLKVINASELMVNWDDKRTGANPRKFFGKKKDWEAFRDSINDLGVQSPIRVYLGADGKYHLRHGFRRMKAVQEIMATNPDFTFNMVPVEVVNNNEKEELQDHFTLNSLLGLSDIEQAEGLRRYRQLTGEKNVKEIARQLGLEYVKTINLLKFIDAAHPDVIKAVNDGNITFSMAKNVVKNAANRTEQSKLIREGKSAAKKSTSPTGKIRAYHIGKVNEAMKPKDLDTKIFDILEDAKSSKKLDTQFISRMLEVLTAIKDGKDEKEVEEMLTPMAIAS